MKLWAACAILGLVAACGGAVLQAPVPADVDRARSRWPDVTLTKMESGRTLYRAKCSRCHLPYAPDRFSPRRWEIEIAAMRERAGVSIEEEELILQYLVAIALRTRDHTSGE